MTVLLDALKTLATQEETPSDDERAIDAIIAECDGDARVAAMSLLKISRTLAFELHVMAELRSYDRLGCVSH
jgi:hypothetical protein